MNSINWIFIFALIAAVAGFLQIIDILRNWLQNKKKPNQESTDSSLNEKNIVLRRARNQNRFAMLMFTAFFVSQIFYPEYRLAGQKAIITLFAAVIFIVQLYLTFIFWIMNIIQSTKSK